MAPPRQGERPSQDDFRGSGRRSLWVAFALISSYMVAEVIGGLVADSLALLADAGHMFTDTAAIGLALFALWMAGRPASTRRTFGFYRIEVLTALLNVMSLWLIAAWIFVEASRRFLSPSEVSGAVVLGMGLFGAVVNLAAAWVLRPSSHRSMNVEAAFLHVLADLLGSLGVIGAGVLILAFGWFVADPVFAVIIGALIILGSGRLLWKVLHVLMEGTPSLLDLQRLCRRLEQVEGVSGVHDIHAWSITTGYDVLSAHVTADTAGPDDSKRLLRRLREIASKEFGINHVTIQLERSATGCEEDHHIAHSEQSPSNGQASG